MSWQHFLVCAISYLLLFSCPSAANPVILRGTLKSSSAIRLSDIRHQLIASDELFDASKYSCLEVGATQHSCRERIIREEVSNEVANATDWSSSYLQQVISVVKSRVEEHRLQSALLSCQTAPETTSTAHCSEYSYLLGTQGDDVVQAGLSSRFGDIFVALQRNSGSLFMFSNASETNVAKNFTEIYDATVDQAMNVIALDPDGNVLWARSLSDQSGGKVNTMVIHGNSTSAIEQRVEFLGMATIVVAGNIGESGCVGTARTVAGVSTKCYGASDGFIVGFNALNGAVRWVHTAGQRSSDDVLSLQLFGDLVVFSAVADSSQVLEIGEWSVQDGNSQEGGGDDAFVGALVVDTGELRWLTRLSGSQVSVTGSDALYYETDVICISGSHSSLSLNIGPRQTAEGPQQGSLSLTASTNSVKHGVVACFDAVTGETRLAGKIVSTGSTEMDVELKGVSVGRNLNEVFAYGSTASKEIAAGSDMAMSNFTVVSGEQSQFTAGFAVRFSGEISWNNATGDVEENSVTANEYFAFGDFGAFVDDVDLTSVVSMHSTPVNPGMIVITGTYNASSGLHSVSSHTEVEELLSPTFSSGRSAFAVAFALANASSPANTVFDGIKNVLSFSSSEDGAVQIEAVEEAPNSDWEFLSNSSMSSFDVLLSGSYSGKSLMGWNSTESSGSDNAFFAGISYALTPFTLTSEFWMTDEVAGTGKEENGRIFAGKKRGEVLIVAQSQSTLPMIFGSETMEKPSTGFDVVLAKRCLSPKSAVQL